MGSARKGKTAKAKVLPKQRAKSAVKAKTAPKAVRKKKADPYTLELDKNAANYQSLLAAMIDAGTRLVITAESGGPPPAWYQHVWHLAWDTPYTWHAVEEFNCSLNRGSMSNDLFLINHWLSTEFDTPSEAGAKTVNTYEVLHGRATTCQTEVGRMPNFLAVDFYDHGDLFAVVDALNGVGP